MKNLFVFTFVLISFSGFRAHADGEWQGTFAHSHCYYVLAEALKNCPTDYHTPDSFSKLFTSKEKYDSFMHVSHTCPERNLKGTPVNINKYAIKYDSIKNICYVGLAYNEESATVTIFRGNEQRAVAKIILSHQDDMEKFIEKNDFSLATEIIPGDELMGANPPTHIENIDPYSPTDRP